MQVTDTQVSVISPPNIEGEVPITLTTSSGSVSKPNAYTYTAAPTITQQPVNQSASVGSTASFSAEATGTPTPTVQWQRSIDGVNWVDISGANLTTYTTPTLSISDNGSQYRAVFTNEIGQAVTNAALLTVSQPPPQTPILTDVISNVAPTGPINNGGTTNDPQPTFSGTAEAGDLISVYDGSTLIGTTTAAADGSWTFTPIIPLLDGSHSFTFTATNAGGGTSTPTAPFNFTVDTTAPAAPILLALTSNVPPNQGPIADNGFTNDTQPTANGTAEAGTVISIFDNGSLIGTTPVDVAGNWTFMSPTLAEGTHSFTFAATDVAGNMSPQTAPFTFTVDTTPPAVPVLSDVTSHVSPVGSITNGGTTRDTQPTFSGTAEPGAVIFAINSNVVMGETTVGTDGTWTFTPLSPLSDNTYSFTFTATDSAGNTSGQTAPFIFTVDTVPPPVPVISSVMDTVPPNTGVITNGGITNDPQPVFSGTAQANAIITAMDGGTVIGTTTVDASGNWIFTPPTLTDGLHAFTFTATDEIGNVSPASAPFTFTVDTLAPDAPTVSVTTTSGPISNGDSTNDTQPIFSGTAEPGAIITITEGVDVIGTTTVGADGNWTFTPGASLTLGSHTLLFVATDAAGNTSPASTFSLTIT